MRWPRGGAGAPHRSVGDFGTVAGLELGLGYAVSSAVRLEALVAYRPRFTFDGRANFLDPDRRQSVSADLAALSGILAPVFPSKKEGIGLRGAFVVMARRLCGEGVRAPFLSSLTYPGTTAGSVSSQTASVVRIGSVRRWNRRGPG